MTEVKEIKKQTPSANRSYEVSVLGVTVANINHEQAEILKKNTEGKDFNYKQVQQLVYGLSEKVDISMYADPGYTDMQMSEIRIALGIIERQRANGLATPSDINLLARKVLNEKQMAVIRNAFALEIPNEKIALFADPKYTHEQMDEIMFGILKDIDVKYLLDPDLSPEEMAQRRNEILQQEKQQNQVADREDKEQDKEEIEEEEWEQGD